MTPPRSPSRIVPRNAGERVRRLNLRTRWWQDLYHETLTTPWPLFVLAGSLLYVAVNAVFAALYLLQPGSIQGARPGSFADAFFFSVQCLSTIGFGALVPATFYANALTTLEAIASLALVALATGSVFARISRPRARVMFAGRVVVCPHNGVPTLHLRLGNERWSQILEADVRVALLRTERTAEGDEFRRFYDLALARSHTPVFALTFTVMHPITDASPLRDATPEGLEAQDAELLITVTGLEETTSQTVHARHSYKPGEILWDHRFADIFGRDEKGRRSIDYGRFHHTEPAPSWSNGP
jgi:inward rectifier potassium channel